MRIVYCLDSLGSGGIEQITIVKANALAEIEGNRVWLLYTDLPMSGGFHIPSEKVHLMDLGIRYKDNHLKFPWSLFRYKRDNRRHKEKVFVALKEINPDIVVSTGMREKYFLYTLKGNWAVLRELHVSKGVRFLTAKSLRDKLVVRFLEKKEFHGLLEKYDRIIVLSQYEKEASWHNDPRVVVIPNPATIRNGKISSLNPKRIVAAGRLESGKNYDSLIRMFGALPNRFNDWTLHIYGEGTQKRSLAALINKSGLKERVFLDGFVSDME